MNLSVVVITKNEQANLRRCLASVLFADEIVIVDDNSTDGTRAIAADFGAKIISPEWIGFGPAKRAGVAAASGDWILSLDADEEVTSELADEIKQIVTMDANFFGYEMPRRTQFLGRWIYHCGWYPDQVLRLFRRGRGNFTEARVHETVELSGPAGRLKGEILHYSYPDLESYFEKFNRYTTIAAEQGVAEGRRPGGYDIIVRPLAAFIKHYFTKRGFLDGVEGFLISVLSSVHVMVKYAKMRHLARRGDKNGTA